VSSDTAPLEFVGKQIEFSYRFESSRMLGPHNRICLTTPNSRFEHLAVPLLGRGHRLRGQAEAVDEPAPEDAAPVGRGHVRAVALEGRAWSGWARITMVQVSLDGGDSWEVADLEPALDVRGRGLPVPKDDADGLLPRAHEKRPPYSSAFADHTSATGLAPW
jgi:hypothetical protein